MWNGIEAESNGGEASKKLAGATRLTPAEFGCAVSNSDRNLQAMGAPVERWPQLRKLRALFDQVPPRHPKSKYMYM